MTPRHYRHEEPPPPRPPGLADFIAANWQMVVVLVGVIVGYVRLEDKANDALGLAGEMNATLHSTQERYDATHETMRRQIQWLCVQRARDNRESNRPTEGDSPC